MTAVNHDGSIVGLSTRAHTEWTFASAAPSGWQSVLPLVDIDYTDVADAATGRSALDLANTAPASRLISLHLTATHQLGSTAPAVSQLGVQVSYDDGATWQAASVQATGDGAFEATYRHPVGGDYVSLKVRASDDAGNAFEQTLTRAYRLR